jgi:muconate cycloisomerase
VKILSIETIPVRVPIDPGLAVFGARGGHTESPFLFLRIATDEGLVGLGEVSCTPGWSGEDQVTAAHLIHSYLAPVLVGHDPLDLARLSAEMERRVANNPFTRAGVEMALWDLAGKAAGLPLYRLWAEAQRDAVPTKFSVSGRPPERAAEIAAWAVSQGYTAMKVKVGGDLTTDLARVAAVRAAIGPDVRLGVDANGGWSPWVALEAVRRLPDYDVFFVEQPVAPNDVSRLAAVRAASPVPLLADESVNTVFEAMAIARAGAADAFSIYVGSGGGLGMARRVAQVAYAAGLACTVGSNLEMGVATAAMIHLGMVLPPGSVEAFPCDILSWHFYEDMLLREPLDVTATRAVPPDRPGLGVELDQARLDRYRVH